MEKRELNRLLSEISLVLAAFFFLNTSTNITGSFIGVSIPATASSLFSLAFLLLSSLFYTSTAPKAPLEDLVKSEFNLANEMANLTAGEKIIYILDSSAIFTYSENTQKLLTLLNTSKGNFYITKSVLNEVHDYPTKSILEKNVIILDKIEKDPNNYKHCIDWAQSSLEGTIKNENYLIAKEFIQTGKPPKNLDNTKMNQIIKTVKTIQKNARPGETITKDYILKKLDQNYGLSNTDADILAEGIYFAGQNINVVILSNDNHLKQAVENLNKKGNRNVHYLPTYTQAVA
ncbi:hypothetical protein J4403_04295 [Candidatus Woesearchaeota archaeon]|nr:hypothetical protein [Candidatus Woesearchaeota archaeon]